MRPAGRRDGEASSFSTIVFVAARWKRRARSNGCSCWRVEPRWRWVPDWLCPSVVAQAPSCQVGIVLTHRRHPCIIFGFVIRHG